MTAAGISDGKLFRDSFKGYNREDVHKFIEKMSREHAESENALKIGCDRVLRQKSELERIIAGLKESNSTLESEIKALSEQVAAAQVQSADTSEQARLEEEVVRLREQLVQKDEQLVQKDEQIVQKDTELAQLRDKAAQPVSVAADLQSGFVFQLDGADGTGKFDEAFRMIGSFLQLANDTAKTTVSEAKQKAEDIVREAYEEKEAYIKERQDRLSELNRQYAELCQRSSGIIKELMQVHGALDGQLQFSGKLFGGDENGEV
ncbi:MAG: hypothetical protein AB9835_03490 [Eubacteriales bacterium]